ncbi:MAG: spondin domain-containing protein [Thermaurantiacus sp.]
MTIRRLSFLTPAAVAMLALAGTANAAVVRVTVTAQNLAPQNSVSFAPLHFGFHNGTFDSFNIGEEATAPIISVAEGGSGADWIPAFRAAEPNAVIGMIGGALTPGATSASMTFLVNSRVNPFFTFASMVIPSNDHFIGNDNPMQYRLFDDAGNLLITQIDQQARQIWDAGSEITDPFAAAFLVIGDNDLRTPENGVVRFDFQELLAYNGLETAAGYIFQSNLAGNTAIYRISFSSSVVPEPGTWAMLIAGFGLVGAAARRNRLAVARTNA